MAIPHDVDILIAGFPCVDFSTLNAKKKGMAEGGESGEVLHGILTYAKTHKPAVILLENVEHADWETIRGVWCDDQNYVRSMMTPTAAARWLIWDESHTGYYCEYNIYDTKQFYIPHTRRRGYMFLVRKSLVDPHLSDTMLNTWLDLFEWMKRPASSSVGAFVLPDDDLNLQRSKVELSKTTTIRSEVDWTLCTGRHQNYRKVKKLGTGRPITQWVEGGSAQTPDHGWQGWQDAQVERIFDTLDIAFLRRAHSMTDALYRERVWELSQNVDRDKDTHPTGVTGCMTPTGMPYLTTRGGPITGREVLGLQGLPASSLILTRETDRVLQHLAGNAMTSTVIGASIICALIAATSALTRNVEERNEREGKPVRSHEDSSLTPNTPDINPYMNTEYLLAEKPLMFEAGEIFYAEVLCTIAWRSKRFCYCEGSSSISRRDIMICIDCGNISCDRCGVMPAHNYERLPASARLHPQDCKLLLEKTLPMRIQIGGLTGEHLDEIASPHLHQMNLIDWSIVREAAILINNTEFRYYTTKRTHCLTIIYDAPGARLDFVVNKDRVRCSLYGVAATDEPGNSRVRQLLKYPIACKTVRYGDVLDTACKDIKQDGQWSFCIPTNKSFDAEIKGQGEKVASWQAKLGLEEFEEKKVWPTLEISLPTATDSALVDEIVGVYESLSACGKACSSLHKKVMPRGPDEDMTGVDDSDDSKKPDIFLFLDPDPIGEPVNDEFVFSTDIHRPAYGETRHVLARFGPSWRQSDEAVSKAECHVYGTWVSCNPSLQIFEDSRPVKYAASRSDSILDKFTATSLEPNNSTTIEDRCKTGALAIASLRLPLDTTEPDQSRYGFESHEWKIVPPSDELEFFKRHNWMCSKVRSLDGFAPEWRPLTVPSNVQVCQKCSPEIPDVKWRWSRSGPGPKSRKRIVPYEDQQEAGKYERALKERPPMFSIRRRINREGPYGELQIALNVASLVHRAINKLKDIASSTGLNVSWRLNPDYQESAQYSMRRFRLSDNAGFPRAVYEFPVSEYRLRREQERTLYWMILQESSTAAPWIEQETEEALLPALGWRAEARVTRNVERMGGVLADIVGYGKTATTLALADQQKEITQNESKERCKGFIALKATLIIVPPQLVIQWSKEIVKFLGVDPVTLIIDTQRDLSQATIQDLANADFIIVNVDVFKHASYWKILALLTGLPEGPNVGGRPFEAWRTRAQKELEKFVEELQTKTSLQAMEEFAQDLQEKFKQAQKDQELVHELPTKQKKGSRYVHYSNKNTNDKGGADDQAGHDQMELDNDEEAAGSSAKQPEQPEQMEVEEMEQTEQQKTTLTRKYRGISKAESWTQMKGVVFELFRFARLVTDEYTAYYPPILGAIESINAPRKWLLSGTPKLTSFADLRQMASLMSVNLGVYDEAVGIYPSDPTNVSRIDKSDAENFRAYGYIYSLAWHAMRHRHAQDFLHLFTRQNVPELKHRLVHKVVVRPVAMYAIENVVHKELQYQIECTNYKVIRRRAELVKDDRNQPINRLLRDCNTPIEALLRSAAYYSRDVGTEGASISGGGASFTRLINRRQKQLQHYAEEMKIHLRKAVWLAVQCRRSEAAKDTKDALFIQWADNIIHDGQAGDKFATDIIHGLIRSAARDYSDDHEEEFYRDIPPGEEPAKKKRAKGKGAKGKRGKGKPAPQDDALQEDQEDQEDDAPQEENTPEVDKRPAKILRDDFAKYQFDLRTAVRTLRQDTKQMTIRIRSLRYADRVFRIVTYSTGGGPAPCCEQCQQPSSNLDDLLANVGCGHLLCRGCLGEEAYRDNCLIKDCHAVAPTNRLKPTTAFTGMNEDTCRYGGKMDAIISLINSISKNDQIIVFVQYETLMVQVRNALTDSGITNAALTDDQRAKAGTIIEDFKENKSESKVQVLILNSGNDTAAGTYV